MSAVLQAIVFLFPAWCVAWVVIAPLFEASALPPGLRWVAPLAMRCTALVNRNKKTFWGVILYAVIGSDILVELIDASLPWLYPYIANNEEIFLFFVRVVVLFR